MVINHLNYQGDIRAIYRPCTPLGRAIWLISPCCLYTRYEFVYLQKVIEFHACLTLHGLGSSKTRLRLFCRDNASIHKRRCVLIIIMDFVTVFWLNFMCDCSFILQFSNVNSPKPIAEKLLGLASNTCTFWGT